MHAQDSGAFFKFGQWNNDLTIEATRSKQGGIKDIGAVGRCQDDDSFGGLETIHFRQHLIQGLFTLVMATTESGTTLATN